MKSGVKTSEFWVVIGGIVFTVMTKLAGFDLNEEQFLGVWGSIVAYIFSRGMAKKTG